MRLWALSKCVTSRTKSASRVNISLSCVWWQRRADQIVDYFINKNRILSIELLFSGAALASGPRSAHASFIHIIRTYSTSHRTQHTTFIGQIHARALTHAVTQTIDEHANMRNKRKNDEMRERKNKKLRLSTVDGQLRAKILCVRK